MLKSFPRGCQRNCAGIKWETSCLDWYRSEAGQRDGNSRTGTNKPFLSEMSGVIGGNINNYIEKRTSNVTAKHPTDIQLTAWKIIYLYIKGILEEAKTKKIGGQKDVSANKCQMSLSAEDRLNGSCSKDLAVWHCALKGSGKPIKG